MSDCGARRKQSNGRRVSRITAPGDTAALPVSSFRGKNLCIVFYPNSPVFTRGVQEFAEQQEAFTDNGCEVMVCTADSSWATWSTSVGLSLHGQMAAESLDRIREEAFIPDPTSYDIPTVSLLMLDHLGCIRHVMTTSLEPAEAVASALDAAITMNEYNLPDPAQVRTMTRERTFEKQKFDRFKRRSYWDMKLNTESGQIKYLGEAALTDQCHLPISRRMLQEEESDTRSYGV